MIPRLIKDLAEWSLTHCQNYSALFILLLLILIPLHFVMRKRLAETLTRYYGRILAIILVVFLSGLALRYSCSEDEHVPWPARVTEPEPKERVEDIPINTDTGTGGMAKRSKVKDPPSFFSIPGEDQCFCQVGSPSAYYFGAQAVLLLAHFK
jgi:hypothetical protein